ncbi:hypothetical protein [Caulobacter sp. S45]|uniref:hypothetical protein n=1 Tax=Caulobacter sp. S45 TaxID=1641861 RepID=UPI00131BF08A|nr:hypothetical protein [Caulobacter sp. S45]
MSPAETDERGRQRFAVMLAHLIEHTESHTAELAYGSGALATDAVATRLLDTALADLAVAHQSLGRLLELLSGDRGGAEPHMHAHTHAHSHAT